MSKGCEKTLWLLRVVSAAVLLLSSLALSSPTFAQASIWGGGTGVWTAPNWIGGGPGPDSSVFIDDGNPTASAVTFNLSAATINNLTLDVDDSLTLELGTHLTVNGTTLLYGSTNVGLGTLTLNSLSVSTQDINLETLEIPTRLGTNTIIGAINGNGALNNSGFIEGAGAISIPLINSYKVVATDGNAPLVLSGDVDNTGGLVAGIGGILMLDGATVTNGIVSGNIAAQNGGALSGVQLGTSKNDFVDVVGGSALLLRGTVTNVGELGTDGGVSVVNNGTLNSTDSASISNYGSVTNSAGAQMIGGQDFINKDGATLSNAGVLQVATLETAGTVTNFAGAQMSTGEFTIYDGTVTNAGTLNASDISNNSGTLNNSGAVTASGLSVGGSVNNTAGTMQVGGTFLNYGSVTNSAGAQFIDNAATINKDGATLNNAGIFTNQGSFLNGGTVTMAGSAILNGTGAFSNEGTIHGGGILDLPIANSGTIIADDASTPLVIEGDVTDPNSASIIRATNGGTLTIDPATVNAQSVGIDAGSMLNGVGTINVNDDVGNGGIVAPGINAPGKLTINGIYEQSKTGILDFLLGGDQAGQYSQLDVNGYAIFEPGSIIEADFFGGFDPSANCANIKGVCETFDVLNASFAIETQTTTIDPSTGFPVTHTNLGISGLDFDLPTLTNGLTWSEVDANNELLLEITSLGQGSGSDGGSGSGGTTPAPEPPSLLLLASGLAAICLLLRPRKIPPRHE